MLAEAVCGIGVELGESPLWDDGNGQLRFVDISAGALLGFNPKTATTSRVDVDGYPSAVVPCDDGRLLVCRQGEILIGHADRLPFRRLTELERDRRDHRSNDAKCDPRGRLFVGTMPLDAASPTGTLYRVTPNAAPQAIVTGLYCANGLGWTADGQHMYLVDSVPGTVDVFEFDPLSGTAHGRRTVITIPEDEGLPDGLCLDSEDTIWLALWGGSAVRRYDSQGRLQMVIDVPTSYVSSCCFGGVDYADLYITSARGDDGQGGDLYRVRPDARGRPADRFRTAAHA